MPRISPNILLEMLVTALMSKGVPLSFVQSEEMRIFLEQTVGVVPSPMTLYDSIGFKIEQKILADVRVHLIDMYGQESDADAAGSCKHADCFPCG